MKRVTLLGMVLLLFLTTGCWDSRSLDRRAFVAMMGIDVSPEGQFRVSLQVQTAGYQQQRGGGQQGAVPPMILVSTGGTVRQAVAQAQNNLARSLDFALMNVIVLGESVTRTHLEELDWLLRGYGFPVSVYVVVTPGEAEEIMRSRASGYTLSAHFVDFSMAPGSGNRSSALVEGHLWLMWNRNWFTPLEDMYAPVLIANEVHELKWAGAAVFHRHALAGYLSEAEAATLNLLLASRSDRLLSATVPGRAGARATMMVHKAGVRRRVRWEGDRPVISIAVNVGGDLQELVGASLESPAAERDAEAAMEDALIREVKDLLTKLQDLGSDPVGFGELARQAGPYRSEVQSGPAWRAAFRRARLDVTAKVQILAPGFAK